MKSVNNATRVNRKTTRRARGPRRPAVAVCLKQQEILPLCIDVINACTKGAPNVPPEIRFIDPTPGKKVKLWLDEVLFKEALLDLLQNAVKRNGSHQAILFTVSFRGMYYCCINITCSPGRTEGATQDELFGRSYYTSGRTLEIIQQHRARVNHSTEREKETIELCFSNS